MYSETTFRLLTACGGEEPLLWWAWVSSGLGLTLRSHISCVSLYVGWLQQSWTSPTEFLLWPSQKKENFSETIFNLDRLSFLVWNKIHGTVESANACPLLEEEQWFIWPFLLSLELHLTAKSCFSAYCEICISGTYLSSLLLFFKNGMIVLFNMSPLVTSFM